MVWHVYLGNATSGGGELLEDDGRSTEYLRGQIARTAADYSIEGATMRIAIGAQAGNYSGSPAARWVEIVVHNVLAPVASTRLGLTAGELNAAAAVRWDASELTATITIGAVQASRGGAVQLAWAASPLSSLLCQDGRVGWVRLHQRVMAIKRGEIDATPTMMPQLRSHF